MQQTQTGLSCLSLDMSLLSHPHIPKLSDKLLASTLSAGVFGWDSQAFILADRSTGGISDGSWADQSIAEQAGPPLSENVLQKREELLALLPVLPLESRCCCRTVASTNAPGPPFILLLPCKQVRQPDSPGCTCIPFLGKQVSSLGVPHEVTAHLQSDQSEKQFRVPNALPVLLKASGQTMGAGVGESVVGCCDWDVTKSEKLGNVHLLADGHT